MYVDTFCFSKEEALKKLFLNINTLKNKFKFNILETLICLLRSKYPQALKEKIFSDPQENSIHNLIEYCQHTKIKSPFVNKFLLDNQISKNDIVQLTNDAKIHLNYILEKNGMLLKSPTRFGEKKGQDIVLFEEEKN